VKYMTTKALGVITTILAVTLFLVASDVMVGADNESPSSDAVKKARVEYAQAMVDRAKANLATVRDVNKNNPGAIATASVRPFENDLSLAEARLKASQASDDQRGAANLEAAKLSLATAETALKRVQDINARVPNTVTAVEMQNRQSDVALAQARLRIAQLLLNASPMDRLEADVVCLQDEVRELRRQVELLQSRN
jgi:hypothetical protein